MDLLHQETRVILQSEGRVPTGKASLVRSAEMRGASTFPIQSGSANAC